MIARYFELDHYVPHVTLGQTMRGMTALELQDMGHVADEILRPFPTFDVTGVRIYQEIDGRYEPFRDVPKRNGQYMATGGIDLVMKHCKRQIRPVILRYA